jgi:Tfp pilus assembly protein PilN
LIPADERRTGRGTLSRLSAPTRALLGALALVLVASLAYVLLANQVTERRDRLAQIEADAGRASAQAAALKPFTDVAELRDRSVAAVRDVAAARFDWPGLLTQLSARVPADVTLISLSASPGDETTAAGVPPATADGAAAPGAAPVDRTVALTGCTTDHDSVARLMERLRAISGVADVTLATSTAAGGDDAGRSGGCPRPDQFELSVHLAPTAGAPAPQPGA